MSSSTSVRSIWQGIEQTFSQLPLPIFFPTRGDFLRALVGLATFFLLAYLSFVTSAIAGYRVPHVQFLDPISGEVLKDQHTLPDYGHQIVAFVMHTLGYEIDHFPYYHAGDNFLKYLGNTAILFTFLHPYRHVILRRIPVILGLVFILRILCIFSTTLPDASPKCFDQFGTDEASYKSKPMFPIVFWRAFVLLTAPGQHVTCGDMVFSGHSTCLYFVIMLFMEYCQPKYFIQKPLPCSTPFGWLRNPTLCFLLRTIMMILPAVGIILIIASKFHYTLDVVLAIFISHVGFRQYHDWIEWGVIGRKLPQFFLWLEGEADYPINLSNWVFWRAKEEKKV